MNRIKSLLGISSQSYVKSFMSERPSWVDGSLSRPDACFLFDCLIDAPASPVVEFGTGPGFSTAVLCQALHFANQLGLVGSDFQVVSYDKLSRYPRCNRRIGAAAREQLSPELQNHIVFRNPVHSLEAVREFETESVGFLFIDANHNHPWATLDLIAALDCLKVGAQVILHDINLPLIHPEYPDKGAHYLFNDIDAEKLIPDEELPNIGRITIPEDKARMRSKLLEILFSYEWRSKVGARFLNQLGIKPIQGRGI